MNTVESAFLQTEGLCLRYGDKPALEDVTLAVARGQITALIGPSGCGKTSFLQCLNRLTDLIPACKVTGRVRVGELDVFDPRTDLLALRKRVGMIFQKPNPFPFSVRRNLEFPLREHGVRDRGQLAEKMESALRDVGLWDEVKDRLDKSAQSLSGGQQQRLCLARALALGPEVLLLDEPCSALDPISSGVVEDLMLGLRERYTLLVVTHNLAQARRIADHVALFWTREGAGRLIEHGPVRRVFENPLEQVTRDYVTGMRG
jgi:phosphate transport system ATP-binding protein